jgi:hypothetical protein
MTAALMMWMALSLSAACKDDASQLCPQAPAADAQTQASAPAQDRKAVVKCLAKNKDKLQPSCSKALRRAHRVATFRRACAADWKEKCADTAPGGGKIIACLKKNEATLSDACKARLAKHKALKGGQIGEPDLASVAADAVTEEEAGAPPVDEELASVPEE